jgi:para-aminobenzoate synthetase / 4-amino-4-deoxychorismate lyase
MMRPEDFERAAHQFSRQGTFWFESAFCRGLDCEALLFTEPDREIVLLAPSGLEAFFRDMEELLDGGYYLAGWLSYEAGHGFEKSLEAEGESGPHHAPLAWFGAYRSPLRFSDEDVAKLFETHAALVPFDPSELSPPVFSITGDDYTGKIGRIRDEIARGNVYQVNFTGRYRFTYTGMASALFSAMRKAQPFSYSAFTGNAGHSVLSFSPELFFRCSGPEIETMPMKGTAPRGEDPSGDEQLREKLGSCEKNRAENLMIVDLIRNDLGRICRPGTIEATGLFRTETYPTLHQMVSSVRGTMPRRAGPAEIFRALFPSGSVTGAPKIKAMQLIRELEDGPRGIYTGSLGFITPDREMAFSVAIRTVELFGSRGVYGSGSGIVWDSSAEDEYRECQIKAKILSELAAGEFSLFETILWSGAYLWLPRHLDRMAGSASALGFRWDRNGAAMHLETLHKSLRASGGRFKVRLFLSRDGAFTSDCEPVEHSTSAAPIRLCLAADRLDSSDPLARHKTTRREMYDRYFASAQRQGYGDVLFLNERGEVCEGAISTLFIRKGSRFFTPPLSSGLLDGVYRRYFLETRPDASEKTLALQELLDADMVYAANSVRGLRRAIFTGDRLSA